MPFCPSIHPNMVVAFLFVPSTKAFAASVDGRAPPKAVNGIINQSVWFGLDGGTVQSNSLLQMLHPKSHHQSPPKWAPPPPGISPKTRQSIKLPTIEATGRKMEGNKWGETEGGNENDRTHFCCEKGSKQRTDGIYLLDVWVGGWANKMQKNNGNFVIILFDHF